MTETTQPDPAAEWRAHQIEEGRRAVAAMSDERRADVEALIGEQPDLLGSELAEALGLTPRSPRPLTRSDIPAGQGPASLYVGRPEAFRRTGLGEFALLFKRTDGSSEVVDWPPEGQSPGSAALWDHLAATLPHVATEEES